MSGVPPEQPAVPRRKTRRWLIIALVGVVLIGAVIFLTRPPPGEVEDLSSGARPALAVFPIKHRPEPPKLGIEYHFDRNAVVDSRLLEGQIVGLTASGNLVIFDARTFQVRREKVFSRRSTCLGPVDKTNVLVGIANGSIVRVDVNRLAIEQVADVPGTPRWIGKHGKDGALVVAYQSDSTPESNVYVSDQGSGRTYDVGRRPILFLDSKDRLWYANGDRVRFVNLATGTFDGAAANGAWPGLNGFAELSDGQIWAFGGEGGNGELASYVVRLLPGPKPVLIHGAGGKHRVQGAPTAPITQLLEEQDPSRVLVISREGVQVTDADLSRWQPLDEMAAGRHDGESIEAIGQVHPAGQGVILALARGGFLEVTPEFTRRHQLAGQFTLSRPSDIVRLMDGAAFYGDGGPLFYKGGRWQALPDTILPPAEFMGLAAPGEKDRTWAAVKTLPIEGEVSYVLAKAGSPRHTIGHPHGLRDVFVTAHWNGQVLTTLGREELSIEPDDTYRTPDRQLWNVDDRGLWNFTAGRWRMVIRAASESAGAAQSPGALHTVASRANINFKSAISERLHFAQTALPPYYGLPSSGASWVLVRLDLNDTGGAPLIDEIPVKMNGRRLLLHDVASWGSLAPDLLLATDQGLCAFSIKFGNCTPLAPKGLDGEVNLLMHDGTRRLWLGGRGLWVLRDRKEADEIHSAIPMLRDTRVVGLAESPDGRLIISTEDRGVVFLSIPQGWFQQPPVSTAALRPWEVVHPHEPSDVDRGVVIRECRGKGGRASDAAAAELVTGLRDWVKTQGPRVRLALEDVFDGHPDVVVRGPEPDKLLAAVLPLVEKIGGKAKWGVLKRVGPRGIDTVDAKPCPP